MTLETHESRCTCPVCRSLDALPDRLQGWPGAWQMTLFYIRPMPARSETVQPRSLDDWNYPGIREACVARCEGDPACFEMNGSGPIDAPYCNKPCGECWRDVGVEPGDEFDEAAAVGRLV